MSPAPALAIFDVNETLFSLERMGERLVDEGLPDEALQIWFARTLRDGIALAATGVFATFLDLAQTNLSNLLRVYGRDGTPEQAGNLLATFKELDPHPDVEPCFQILRDAGVRIVTLTNGDADNTVDLLARGGLDDYVERCFSVDAVRAWKPLPAPYLHVADECGVAPGDVALVAVHTWDCHGALRAGLRAAYASRLEGGPLPGFDAPDVTGPTLIEVAERLVG